MERIRLCGVHIDPLSVDASVDCALEERGDVCVVYTPNATMLEACRRDARLQALLNRATLSLADGVGVLRAAKRNGYPAFSRVAGIDFGDALLERAAKEGLRVYLLGGKERVAASAATRLCARFPRLEICGTHHGYFKKTGDENLQVLEQIRRSRAEILLVCFGFPLQERWIDENRCALAGLRTVAGLGGSLDVWSGKVRRAPLFFRRCGLEWMWRMLREPKRLRHLPSLVRFFLWGGKRKE